MGLRWQQPKRIQFRFQIAKLEEQPKYPFPFKIFPGFRSRKSLSTGCIASRSRHNDLYRITDEAASRADSSPHDQVARFSARIEVCLSQTASSTRISPVISATNFSGSRGKCSPVATGNVLRISA